MIENKDRTKTNEENNIKSYEQNIRRYLNNINLKVTEEKINTLARQAYSNSLSNTGKYTTGAMFTRQQIERNLNSQTKAIDTTKPVNTQIKNYFENIGFPITQEQIDEYTRDYNSTGKQNKLSNWLKEKITTNIQSVTNKRRDNVVEEKNNSLNIEENKTAIKTNNIIPQQPKQPIFDDFNDLDFDDLEFDDDNSEKTETDRTKNEKISTTEDKEKEVKYENIEEEDLMSVSGLESMANSVASIKINPKKGVNGVILDNIQSNEKLNNYSNSKDDYDIKYNTSSNYNYTYNELKSYLEVNKDRLMSNRCKEAAEELTKREDKIKKVREVCDKKIKEKREKISKRINKLANRKGPDGRRNIDNPDFLANIVNKDPEIIRYRQKIDTIKHTKESFIKEQQNKFLEWEKRNSKGVNIIVRNNNYLLVKGLTARVSSGELDSKENSAPQYKGTNMVQFANALTHLLSNKIENEKDEEKKNRLQVVMTKLLNTIKILLGQHSATMQQRENNENNLSSILTDIVNKVFDKNENKVKNEIQNIKERETQNINNYKETDNLDIITNKVVELASAVAEKVLGVNITKLETYKKYKQNLEQKSHLEQEHNISKGQNNKENLSYEEAISQLTGKNIINENKLLNNKKVYNNNLSEVSLTTIKTALKDKDKYKGEDKIEENKKVIDSSKSTLSEIKMNPHEASVNFINVPNVKIKSMSGITQMS